MPNSTAVVTSPLLLRQVCNPDNNEAAWQRFLERYQPSIARWCRQSGLKGDDAEEVSAAVLTKLVTALRDFVYDPRQRFRAWLKTVVDHAVLDFWRQKGRRPGDYATGDPHDYWRLEKIADRGGEVDDLVQELDETLARDLHEARQVAERVRQRVRPHTWRAYWLAAIENQPGRDVAKKLGMTVGAVYEAKRKVGRMLREEGNQRRRQTAACESGGQP